MSYFFTTFKTLSALYNEELLLINFPTPSLADYFITAFMPIILLFLPVTHNDQIDFFHGALLSATLWLPATTR